MESGIGAMCARLEALEQKWRDGMQAAISDAAEMAAGRARETVPVDTGFLRASIGHRAEGLSGAATACAPYAAHVEMGTIAQIAQPYLAPAFAQAAEALIRRAGEVAQ